MATPPNVGENLCPYDTHTSFGAEYEQCLDESEDKVRQNLGLPPVRIQNESKEDNEIESQPYAEHTPQSSNELFKQPFIFYLFF